MLRMKSYNLSNYTNIYFLNQGNDAI